MASTRRSVIFSAASNIGSLGLSLILLVVVTRWLAPAEIGAFVVAYAVFAILEPLRMMQLVAYVIQAPELDKALMRRVQFVGWVATGAIVVASIAAGLVMRLAFDNPQAGNLLLLMTVAFPVKAIAQPALAVLNRQMRFGAITWVRLAAAAAKVGVTIALLVAGMRAEALAIGIVVEILVELAFIFLVERAFALPVPSAQGTGPVWGYCLRFSGAQLVATLPNSAVDLLVGSFLGLAAAGFFNRANKLIRTVRSGIEGAIFPVALAVFARAERTDRTETRQAYLAGIALLTGVTWPGLALIAAVAEPLVLTAYGPRWESVVPLVQILALAAMIFATTAMAQPLLASIGAVDTLLKRNLLIQVPRMLIVLAAVQFDLIVVAWGMVLTMLVANLVTERILSTEFSISYSHLIGALWHSFVTAVTTSLVAFAAVKVTQAISDESAIVLFVSMSIGGLAWATAILVTGHPLRQETVLLLRKVRSHLL